MDVKELVEKYGPITKIGRQRESDLIKRGKEAHIFTIVGTDVGYAELSEEDKPTEEELKLTGLSRDEYTETIQEGFVGRRLVNVLDIYETSQPMPLDLEIKNEDIWYGEDGIPT